MKFTPPGIKKVSLLLKFLAAVLVLFALLFTKHMERQPVPSVHAAKLHDADFPKGLGQLVEYASSTSEKVDNLTDSVYASQTLLAVAKMPLFLYGGLFLALLTPWLDNWALDLEKKERRRDPLVP